MAAALTYIRNNPIDCIAYAFIALCTFILLPLLAHDALWFSDDGPAYMLLAKAFSPYYDYSTAVLEGAKRENYPPLFPALLAILGASNSFFTAHIIVGCCFIAGMFVIYWLANGLLNNKPLALLSLIFYSVSPGVFISTLGILSEPLYILLSAYCIIYYYKHFTTNDSIKTSLLLTLLLTAAILTRSIAISFLAALFVTRLFECKNPKFLLDKRYLLPIFVPGLVAVLWHYLRPVVGGTLYEHDVVKASKGVFSNPIEFIMPQLVSLNNAWHSIIQIYWTLEISPAYIIATLAGIIPLIMLAIRMKQNKFDAWYVSAYLCIIIIWPHPMQQVRFLYPVFPVLIIYYFLFFQLIAEKFRHKELMRYSPAFASLILAVLILPPMLFLNKRIVDAKQTNAQRILLASYYHPLRDVSRFNAKLHEHLHRDMDKLKTSIEENETVLWYLPKYIYLLAERKAVEFPHFDNEENFTKNILKSKAKYVYISRFDPWKKGFSSFNQYQEALSKCCVKIWASNIFDDRTQQTVEFGELYRIPDSPTLSRN